MTLAVDASRSRSGGALVHLINLIPRLSEQPRIIKIHVWIHIEETKAKNILESIPKIEVHLVAYTSVVSLLFWQRFLLPREIESYGCCCTFNTDAGTVLSVKPCLTLSQDMFAFEPGVKEMVPLFSRRRLRQEVLRLVQIRSLRNATKRIFLTEYAKNVINRDIGDDLNSVIIPHAVDPEMRMKTSDYDGTTRNSWLYVSYFAEFKHQIEVVNALDRLSIECETDIELTLVGGGNNEYYEKFKTELSRLTGRLKVNLVGFVGKGLLLEMVSKAEVFIFASSCENMPITLMEGMVNSKLILCSNRGPMPEVLKDGGLYFDPKNEDSIIDAAKKMLDLSSSERMIYKKKARERALEFSWDTIAQNYYTEFVGICLEK